MCICEYVYLYLCLDLHRCVHVLIWIYTSVFSFDLFIHSHVFFSRLPFSLIFVLTRGTTMKIMRFCPFHENPAIVHDIHMSVCSNVSTSTFKL